jgi:uncharacterized protein YbaR (Trm112 family)
MTNKLARYIHTLVFVCPNCERPITIYRAREEQNTEMLAAQTFHISCEQCNNPFEVIGGLAKAHSVDQLPARPARVDARTLF